MSTVIVAIVCFVAGMLVVIVGAFLMPAEEEGDVEPPTGWGWGTFALLMREGLLSSETVAGLKEVLVLAQHDYEALLLDDPDRADKVRAAIEYLRSITADAHPTADA